MLKNAIWNRRKESGEREATYEIRKDKIHKLNY